MTGSDTDSEPGVVLVGRSRWRRKRVLAPAAVITLLLLAVGAAWLSRERIAGDIIEGQLAAYGVPATYEIAKIGGQEQVIRKLVIGDPARPDAVIEEARMRLRYRFGTPAIGRITLVRPRLYGRLTGGRVSFGTLDRVLYRDTGKPPSLPELDLDIRDGRALIRTSSGPIGVKLDGSGMVSDGFTGIGAVVAPSLTASTCRIENARLFGKISTRGGEPRFNGPLRFDALSCERGRASVGRLAARLEISADKALDALSGRASVAIGGLRYASFRASGADLTLRGRWAKGLLDESHTVAVRGLTMPQASAAIVTLDGSLRASDGFRRVDMRSDVEGNGLRPGPSFDSALNALQSYGEDTLLAPLARRLATALARQARGSSLSADLAVRRLNGVTSVMVPQAELVGGDDTRMVSLSRVEARLGGKGPPRIAGNLATGGADLPQISGRMERGDTRGMVFRLTMQPYTAGSSSFAIPRMTIAQAADGSLGFSGNVLASGTLPFGATRGLSLPVDGRWTSYGGLSLWRRCFDAAFDRLQIASLAFERRGLTLCPAPGRAIVESNGAGLRIAAGAPELDLAGSLGETPIRLASGPIGFAWPGVLKARGVAVALGPRATESRFSITNLTAKLGGKDFAGVFDGADVRLAAVPLDLRDATGTWRYANGALTLGDGNFRLVDRAADARFQPLFARDAALRLAGNIVTGQAVLRHPESERVVTELVLRHDLSRARGHADLAVPGLIFDDRLQPDQLTARAKGVIANANGTITGTGRVDWTPNGVTSSGDFATSGLDFAAAFGPVRGARGTVHFSDLIGLTTAPGQMLAVDAVNPGIEVLDGQIAFQLRGGTLLAVEGGSWPFMGGRLLLRPVELNFGVEEERRYVFAIEGLDAAAFIARFELPNIAATGLFDGTMPVVFAAGGNGRIEGGQLVSRPPGGNVSYVGDLSYKDLSTMANFAFDALRSLDYERMTIAMNGALTGEIVTNVRFDGVRQGEGAKRNIATRALARLPIQFRINITAPFYQLITSFKSLRDPAAVRDPRELGLLSDDGTRFLRPEIRGQDVQVPGTGAANRPSAQNTPSSSVQN